MSDRSAIEWTQATWNPVTGCNKVSPGCPLCYAETFAEHFRGVPGHPYEQGFDLKLWPDRLELPLRWRAPRMIFVNSMSDLFHEEVSDDYVASVFELMGRASWHTFQILTKRNERLAALAPRLTWPSNVWIGVSIENRRFVHRADSLRQVPAAVRSSRPSLCWILSTTSTFGGIDWLIAGGESGFRRRPMQTGWLVDLRDRCRTSDVAFFFKQWGGRTSKHGGRLLEGREWSEWPRRRNGRRDDLDASRAPDVAPQLIGPKAGGRD